MFRHLTNLRNRIDRLEKASGAGQVYLTMPGGVRFGIKQRNFMNVFFAAVDGQKTVETTAMLNAVSCSDNSKLHELCQALAHGPAKCNTPSPEGDMENDV